MRHAFIVPFRDKGQDPRRTVNAAHVLKYLDSLGLGKVYVTDDGRTGEPQMSASLERVGWAFAWWGEWDQPATTHHGYVMRSGRGYA